MAAAPLYCLEITYGEEMAPRGYSRVCQANKQSAPITRRTHVGGTAEQHSYLWMSKESGGETRLPISNISVGKSLAAPLDDTHRNVVGWERLARPLFFDNGTEGTSQKVYLFTERVECCLEPVVNLYVEMIPRNDEHLHTPPDRILLANNEDGWIYLCIERMTAGEVGSAKLKQLDSRHDGFEHQSWSISLVELDKLTDKFLNSVALDKLQLWEEDNWLFKFVKRCVDSNFDDEKVVPQVNKFLRLVLSKLCSVIPHSRGAQLTPMLEMLNIILSPDRGESLLYRKYGVGDNNLDRYLTTKDLSLEDFFIPAQRSIFRNIGENIAVGLGFALPAALGAAGRSLFTGENAPFGAANKTISTLLLTNLNHFGSSGGWDCIISLIQSVDSLRVTLPQVDQCISLFQVISPLANQDFSLIYHVAAVRYFHKRLLSLDQSDYSLLASKFGFIHEGIRKVDAMAEKGASMDLTILQEASETFLLRLAKQLIFSQQAGMRERGVKILSDLASLCSNQPSVTTDGLSGFTSIPLPVDSQQGNYRIKWLTPKSLQVFLVSERILIEILGGGQFADDHPLSAIEAVGSLRHELLRKSDNLVRFAAKYDMISVHQLQVFWQAVVADPDSGIVIESGVQKLIFHLFMILVPYLSSDFLVFMCEQSKIYLLPIVGTLLKDHILLLQKIVVKTFNNFVSARDFDLKCVLSPIDVLWMFCMKTKDRPLQSYAIKVLLEIFKTNSVENFIYPYLERIIETFDDPSIYSFVDKNVTFRILIELIKELPTEFADSVRTFLIDSAILSLAADFQRAELPEQRLECLELRIKLINSLKTALASNQHIANPVFSSDRASFLLTLSQINHIWNSVMENGDPQIVETFYLWLIDLLPDSKLERATHIGLYSNSRMIDLQTACSILESIADSILNNSISKSRSWAVISITGTGFDFLRRLFLLVNEENGHIVLVLGTGIMVKTSYLDKFSLLLRICRDAHDSKVQQVAANFIAHIVSRFDSSTMDRRIAWINFTQSLVYTLRQDQSTDKISCRGSLMLLASTFEAISALRVSDEAMSNSDEKFVTIFWRQSSSSTVTRTSKYLLPVSATVGSLRARLAGDNDVHSVDIELRTSLQEKLHLESDDNKVGDGDWSVLEATVPGLNSSSSLSSSSSSSRYHSYKPALQPFEEPSCPQMGPQLTLANDQQSMQLFDRILCGDDVDLAFHVWKLIALLPLHGSVILQQLDSENSPNVPWATLFGNDFSLRLLKPLSQMLVLERSAGQHWGEAFSNKMGLIYLTKVLKTFSGEQALASELHLDCAAKLLRLFYRVMATFTSPRVIEVLGEENASALSRNLVSIAIRVSSESSTDEFSLITLSINDGIQESSVDAGISDSKLQITKLCFRVVSMINDCWPQFANNLMDGVDSASLLAGLTRDSKKHIINLKTELGCLCKRHLSLCDVLLDLLIPAIGGEISGACEGLFALVMYLLGFISLENRVDKAGQLVQRLMKWIENSHGEEHEKIENEKLRVHLELLCCLINIEGFEAKDTASFINFAKHLFSSLFFPVYTIKSKVSRDVAFELLSILCVCEDVLIVVCGLIDSQHDLVSVPGDPEISTTPACDGGSLSNDLILSRGLHGIGGVMNPGCVCYICSALQVLYMMPEVRRAIFDIPATQLSMNVTMDPRDIEAIRQLQLLFANLQESVRAAVDPRPFCSTFLGIDGQPTSLFLQQDVSEFLYTFLQRLESVLMGSKQGALVQDALGGELTDELVAEGGRRNRESKQPFFMLSLDIISADTLVQSLQQYVASETVDYSWDIDDATCGGTMIKRTLQTSKSVRISKLPRHHLLLHLKRFRFDMETLEQVKVHKRFEFPMTLDMFPYTKEASEERKHKKLGPLTYSTKCMFELTGVIIHSGQSTSGHYYAYVRESGTQQWLEVNDGWVGPFKVQSMDVEAFSGASESSASASTEASSSTSSTAKSASMSFLGNFAQMLGIDDRLTTTSTTQRSVVNTKSRNAFILVYTRATENAIIRQDGRLRISLPQHLGAVVSKENLSYYRSKLIYSDAYLEFASEIVIEALSSIQTSQDKRVVRTAVSFLFNTLLRARLGGRSKLAKTVKPLVVRMATSLTLALREEPETSHLLLSSPLLIADNVLELFIFGTESLKESKAISLVLVTAMSIALSDNQGASIQEIFVRHLLRVFFNGLSHSSKRTRGIACYALGIMAEEIPSYVDTLLVKCTVEAENNSSGIEGLAIVVEKGAATASLESLGKAKEALDKLMKNEETE